MSSQDTNTNTQQRMHSKQVWTPLRKPPDPQSVHILSDDALLVLAALRAAHWKKVEDQQRRFPQSADSRSYYNQIYRQSFKAEKVDCPSNATPNPDSTIHTKESRAIYRNSSQPSRDFPNLNSEIPFVIKKEQDEDNSSCSPPFTFNSPQYEGERKRKAVSQTENPLNMDSIHGHDAMCVGGSKSNLGTNTDASSLHSQLPFSASLSSTIVPTVQKAVDITKEELIRTDTLLSKKAISAVKNAERCRKSSSPASSAPAYLECKDHASFYVARTATAGDTLKVQKCMLSAVDAEQSTSESSLAKQTISKASIKFVYDDSVPVPKDQAISASKDRSEEGVVDYVLPNTTMEEDIISSDFNTMGASLANHVSERGKIALNTERIDVPLQRNKITSELSTVDMKTLSTNTVEANSCQDYKVSRQDRNNICNRITAKRNDIKPANTKLLAECSTSVETSSVDMETPLRKAATVINVQNHRISPQDRNKISNTISAETSGMPLGNPLKDGSTVSTGSSLVDMETPRNPAAVINVQDHRISAQDRNKISNTITGEKSFKVLGNPLKDDGTVSVGLSTVDVKTLSSKKGSTSSFQDFKTSRRVKRESKSMSSTNSNDAPTAPKKRVVPTFQAKISGLNEKSRNKPEQRSIEEVMGIDRSKAATNTVKSITSLSHFEIEKLREGLSEAEEILMMLTYSDGSTQLRELTEPKKRGCAATQEESVANSLLVAINFKAAKEEYMCISFPLMGVGKETISKDTRSILLDILQSSTRKVCFDAQEMMHTVIINYQLDPQTGCNKWMVMDPKIACWLLDPDNPPITFCGMLKTFLDGKLQLTPNKQQGTDSLHKSDLLLLGPVIGEMTKKLHGRQLWELFIHMEVPLIPILAGMEVQGIQINQELLMSYSHILQDEIKEVESRCYKEAGHPFQITSHSQLRQVLFDELKLDEKCPGQKLARTNVQNLKSTSETVLQKLKGLHPLPELVLNHRQLVKLKSTYIDGLSEYVSGGNIHTNWEHTSASSGRLQSANPNIQNIPKQPLHLQEHAKGSTHDESSTSSKTLWMREPFFSHDEWSFIAADFQSIELRILAHLSQDAVLLKVFNDAGGTDIFVQLTCEWLGLKAEDVKNADRERTKRIVYSVIYGVGAERLAETLNDTKENAKAFTKSFLAKFKGVNTFAHRCISECQRHGYVKTIFNRHRLISNINLQNFHVRSHAERQAVNFVIQGSAADICKLAMIRIMKVLSEKASLRARLLVQIHDELLFEVHDDDSDEVKGLLKDVMESTPVLGESVCQLMVPLPVSLSQGKTWGHLQPA